MCYSAGISKFLGAYYGPLVPTLQKSAEEKARLQTELDNRNEYLSAYNSENALAQRSVGNTAYIPTFSQWISDRNSGRPTQGGGFVNQPSQEQSSSPSPSTKLKVASSPFRFRSSDVNAGGSSQSGLNVG